mgnify:CR=1 FL=1
MLNKNLILSILLLFTTYSFAGNINKEKPKYLWFDAEANFERFSSKDSISYYLEKAKDVGFNQVVVDVKPIYIKVKYFLHLLQSIIRSSNVIGIIYNIL